MASLPTFIYTQILNPTSPSNPAPSDQRAWGAALVLIILVMLLNLVARLVARAFAPKTGR
jgi:phosphate transport system permease protein